MFSVQTVPSAEAEVNPANAKSDSETQTVQEITSARDLEGHNEGQSDSVEQVKTDSTSAEGSYVSLLAAIATVEENDEYRNQHISQIPSTVDYANSSYTGPEHIQALTETDLSSALQDENLVSYQQIQNQNVSYSVNNSGGNTFKRYFIIQPIVPAVFNESSGSASSTLINLSNTPDTHLSLESKKELEDAVANITENAGEDTEETANSEIHPEKSYLVSTNSKGEVRDIQIVQDDHSAVLAAGEGNLSVFQRKSQTKFAKNKQKKSPADNQRKERSFHLKKFSLGDLNSVGKTKKEVLEEYLEKSKLTNAVKDAGTAKIIQYNNILNCSNDQSSLAKEIGTVAAEISESVLKDQNDIALELSKHLQCTEENAGADVDRIENNRHRTCDSETVVSAYSNESQSLSVQGKVMDNIVKENEDLCLPEQKDVDTIEKTHYENLGAFPDPRNQIRQKIVKRKSETHFKGTLKHLKGKKTNTTREKRCPSKPASVLLKRRKRMSDILKETSKVPKLDDTCKKDEKMETDSLVEDVEGRVLEDFCRIFRSEDKCVLHLKPITLKLINPKELLVIEIEVEDDFEVGPVEKGASFNGLTKYHMNLTVPKRTDRKCCTENISDSEQHTKDKPYTRSRKTKMKNASLAEADLNKCTTRNKILVSKREIACGETVISSLKEDGTDCMDELDSTQNLKGIMKLSDTELETTVEDLGNTSDSHIHETGTGTSESKNYDKHTQKTSNTSTNCRRKKDNKSADQTKLDEKGRSSREDSSQRNYTVVISDEGIRMFRCPVCGYMSKYSSNTKRHVDEHTASKDWVCEICGMSFKSNNRLQKHRIVHQKDRPFSCPLCSKKFKWKRVYRCESCGKEISIRQNMDVHVNQHTGLRPWQCEVCGLRFKGPSNLRAHMHQHEEEMRFSCAICFRKFRDRGTYRQHLKRHLGEKKHVCEHCGKSFVISSDLKKHIRTHTGEKPFKCSVCDQQFSDGSSLVRHEKMHAAKFRFECNACRRQYSRKDLCKKHIKKAHADMGPVEVNQVSIEENSQIQRDIKTSRIQDAHPNKMEKPPRKSSNRETTQNTRIKKLKKSWQTLTEEASKRYKEHSVQNLPGTSQFMEYSQPVAPTFSIIDYQPVQTLYANMNQKITSQKPQETGYCTQEVITPQGPVVYQSFVQEPSRF